MTDLTAFGRSLIDDADAATALSTLGVAAAALTLTNKTIATGSGNDVQTQVKIITGTRDTAAASGSQSVTGAGFTPRFIMAFFGATAGANSARIGFGLYDGTTQVNFAQAGGATSLWATDASVGAIRVTDATGSTEYRGVLSFTSDGADIAWTKVGSPTGTIRFYLLCVR